MDEGQERNERARARERHKALEAQDSQARAQARERVRVAQERERQERQQRAAGFRKRAEARATEARSAPPRDTPVERPQAPGLAAVTPEIGAAIPPRVQRPDDGAFPEERLDSV